MTKLCKNCGKPVKRKVMSRAKYCSTLCRVVYNRAVYNKRHGIRRKSSA